MSNLNQCSVRIEKGSGETLSQLIILGFFDGETNEFHIHEYRPNAKFISDNESLAFDLGTKISTSQITDEYVTTRSFTTAELTSQGISPIDLT